MENFVISDFTEKACTIKGSANIIYVVTKRQKIDAVRRKAILLALVTGTSTQVFYITLVFNPHYSRKNTLVV